MKRELVKHFNKAGKTSDGVVMYFGKKESDDPVNAEDLTFWVTHDNEVYIRVGHIGANEETYFNRTRIKDETSKAYCKRCRDGYELHVREHLSTVAYKDIKHKAL